MVFMLFPSHRAHYIEAIMGLSHDSQAVLKGMIESAMRRTTPLQQTRDGGFAMPSQQVSLVDDDATHYIPEHRGCSA